MKFYTCSLISLCGVILGTWCGVWGASYVAAILCIVGIRAVHGVPNFAQEYSLLFFSLGIGAFYFIAAGLSGPSSGDVVVRASVGVAVVLSSFGRRLPVVRLSCYFVSTIYSIFYDYLFSFFVVSSLINHVTIAEVTHSENVIDFDVLSFLSLFLTLFIPMLLLPNGF